MTPMSYSVRPLGPIKPFLSRATRAIVTAFLFVILLSDGKVHAANEALLKLFEILHAKGSISDAEYASLLAAAEEPEEKPAPKPAVTPVASSSSASDSDARLAALEKRVAAQDAEMRELDALIEEQKKVLDPEVIRAKSTEAMIKDAMHGKWYEKLSIRGYTQVRYTALLGSGSAGLNVANDRSVSETESFMIRRGRIILSGDVTDHLFVYAQMDFNGSPGGGGDYGLQMRDLYADIALDADKEFRFRVGQSKVPFGYVNLQSSQNRAPMERPDALNSAVEGERDVGAFFYWAPKQIRERLKYLVKEGLKGSGDYGVLGFGAYSGQGLNRSDQNGEPHWVLRASYPFELPNKQIFELGVQGYMGKFVPTTAAIGAITPTAPSGGIRDERVGVTAIWYPQPFGIEAEWTWGRGPQLSRDFRTFNSEALHGGYVQANYLHKGQSGSWFPFVRWNYYDGGRKFGRNAPWDKVNEVDIGLEWSPRPELELTLMYTHTLERTNTATAPYNDVTNVNRIGFQLQWNY